MPDIDVKESGVQTRIHFSFVYRRAAFLLDRKWPFLLVGFIVLFLVWTVTFDIRRPMWNDELLTFYVSQQATLAGVWKALMTGADQQPPAFYLLIRTFTFIFGPNALALRLPGTIGCLAMSVCLFLFVRRRVGTAYGLVALVLPVLTGAFYFSYEGRPYGIVLGFSSLALLSWQTATRAERRPWSVFAFGCSLACAVAFHYFAVLLLLPFALAELGRYVRTRNLDFPVYAAIAGSALPLAACIPFIHVISTFSAYYWSKPTWMMAVSFFEKLLQPAAIGMFLAIVAVAALGKWLAGQEESRDGGARTEDIYLASGFVLLPLVGVGIAKLLSGGYVVRYSEPAVIGVVILLSYGLYSSGKRSVPAGICAAFLLAMSWQVEAARVYRDIGIGRDCDQQRFARLTSLPANLPLVIHSPHTFVVLSQEAKLTNKGHFVYLADEKLAVKYTKSDTIERELNLMRQFAPFDVQDYTQFIATHSQFLLYGFPEDEGWLLDDLLKTHWPISVYSRDDQKLVYLVGPREK